MTATPKITAEDIEALVAASESPDPGEAEPAKAKLISLWEDRARFEDDSVWAFVSNLVESWLAPSEDGAALTPKA